MAIEPAEYNNEDELQSWVDKNIYNVFGDDIIYVNEQFKIKTKRNKGAIPDGFILDLKNSSWMIIENELIHHDVWNHIAEQVMRYIVAAKSNTTQRKIRDKFIEKIEDENKIETISDQLNISIHQLTQHIENIIENNTPEIIIFIDKVNEDLEDMLEALNATTRVYEVKKYMVNNQIEYQSPKDVKISFETTVEDVNDSKGDKAGVLELLGGGQLMSIVNNVSFYELDNKEKVSIKYSKLHNNRYWYGVTSRSLKEYENQGITHIVFNLGNQSIVKLPIGNLKEYLNYVNTAKNLDNSIKHYHVVIKDDPKVLFSSKKSFEIDDYLFYMN